MLADWARKRTLQYTFTHARIPRGKGCRHKREYKNPMQQHDLVNEPVPHLRFRAEGELLHFSHANGYPPGAYRALLEAFQPSHEIVSSLHRPLWKPRLDPASLRSWQTFADDLICLLEAYNRPAVSIGHSMGAASVLIAAHQRPELFKSLVLVEPVLVPRRFLFLLHFFTRFSPQTVPMIKKTLVRVNRWTSRQEAYEHYRPKYVFKEISDEVLWDYVEHGIEQTEGGDFRLIYSPQWEARCYATVYNLWRVIDQIQVPILAIRGANSDTLRMPSWEKWRAGSNSHHFVEIDNAGHLLPFERPEALADVIRDWL